MNLGRFFRLGNGRRAATILVILVLVGGGSLALAAALGDDVDVAPFVPEPGPKRPTFGSTRGSSGPSQAPDPGAQAGGEVEEFGPDGEGAVVVPDGWNVLSRHDETLLLGNSDGVHLGLSIVTATPTTPATQILADVQRGILAPTATAHVRASDVLGLQPFGSLVTRSSVGYSALRTDAQGTVTVGGNIFVFVREDGLALIVNPEVAPAEHWEGRIADWFPLWNSAASNFAGAPALA